MRPRTYLVVLSSTRKTTGHPLNLYRRRREDTSCRPVLLVLLVLHLLGLLLGKANQARRHNLQWGRRTRAHQRRGRSRGEHGYDGAGTRARNRGCNSLYCWGRGRDDRWCWCWDMSRADPATVVTPTGGMLVLPRVVYPQGGEAKDDRRGGPVKREWRHGGE